MYKVLVLGGKGMLGQMVKFILSRQERLIVKSTTHEQTPESSWFNIENGIEGLRQILKQQESFDYIINCIGILSSSIDENDPNSVRRAELINALFPHKLASLAQDFRVRVIQISTDGVFAKNAGVCLEESTCYCNDIYGKTKKIGEVNAPNYLNLRCSIVGPSPYLRKGLLDWFLLQPRDGEVHGFTDQKWNGVTTLQFAELCKILILDDYFDTVYAESPIHHFCPNQSINKYELLKLFRSYFRPDLTVIPQVNIKKAVSRTLGTNYQSISVKFGNNILMKGAIKALASVMK